MEAGKERVVDRRIRRKHVEEFVTRGMAVVAREDDYRGAAAAFDVGNRASADGRRFGCPAGRGRGVGLGRHALVLVRVAAEL